MMYKSIFKSTKVIFVGLTVLAASTQVGIAEENNTAEDKKRFAYINNGCYQCHGYEGQAGGFGGPRIAPQLWPYKIFAEVLRRPYGVMPAYSPAVLSDEEMKLIYDYLVSIPEPPSVDEVKALLAD